MVIVREMIHDRCDNARRDYRLAGAVWLKKMNFISENWYFLKNRLIIRLNIVLRRMFSEVILALQVELVLKIFNFINHFFNTNHGDFFFLFIMKRDLTNICIELNNHL